MYAGEPGPSYNHDNTKSCIQALLKNRELSKPSVNNCNSDTGFNNHFVAPNYPNFGAASQNAEFTQVSSDPNPNEVNCSENPDNQHDFNYSQKLFHIDDGNLYSIFSPIQGRSYGMKPSFLRKQKYTVQECHSRGRKNMRKGLKFHNFLPSESVTSEKDNGYLRSKWKVHSECRLREEHGTKQITISNWSQSVQNSSTEPTSLEKPVPKPISPPTAIRAKGGRTFRSNASSKFLNQTMSPSTSSCSVDPYDFSLSLQSNSFENSSHFTKNLNQTASTTATTKARDTTRSVASKKDSLTFVLNSLLDKPETTDSRNLQCDTLQSHPSASYQSQKRRRKPVQTRRVVPYVKYLSIMEENDSVPLDLSSKCAPETAVTFESTKEHLQNTKDDVSNQSILTNGNEILENIRDHPSEFRINSNVSSPVPTSCSDNHFSNSLLLGNLLQNKMPMPLMFFSPQVNNGQNIAHTYPVPSGSPSQGYGNVNEKLNMALNAKQIKIKNLHSPTMNMNPSLTNNAQYTIHKSFVKEPHPRIRKRNQRSVIKQKLEDTFKQNGFLVKTKQVSDGEATFCKFRQLRKYTRYYLKSWQQHLPDEVNKMWKGFLPPKTVLPPVAGALDSTNGTP